MLYPDFSATVQSSFGHDEHLLSKGNYSYDFDMYGISWSTPLHNSGTTFFVAERIGWLSLERSTCVLSAVRDSTSTRLSNPEIAH